jgi:hypothetical protein
MRTIAYALALALGVAFATSAFAGDVTMAKTKDDCDKAGGVWDASTKDVAVAHENGAPANRRGFLFSAWPR